jgi:hypothetical protein
MIIDSEEYFNILFKGNREFYITPTGAFKSDKFCELIQQALAVNPMKLHIDLRYHIS